MPKKITKLLSFLLCFVLIFQQTGFSQIAGELDLSSHFQRLGGLFTQDTFRPLHLRYLSFDALSNNFNLLLDKGDLKNPRAQELENTSKELMQYFFIGLALPNEAFWVNLRPDSPNNIIDDELARTDIGRIFLEADLQLKKDTALFTSPQTPEGREYWDKLYKKAAELYGSENITIPTLTRPWIVPGEIIIRESKDNAYIYKATLKVMLEQDYLKDSATYSFKDQRSQALNEYSSQLIRELIIPKLTKEVNSSKRYAPLRQVYYSLILAQWFKQKFPQQHGRNLTDLASKEDWSKDTYFQAYKQSFAEGEYNIKEPVYTPTGQTIRSYFSGGLKMQMAPTVFKSVGSPLGDKDYLIPLSVDKNGIVTQQLSASPVITKDDKDALDNAVQQILTVWYEAAHEVINPLFRISNIFRAVASEDMYNLPPHILGKVKLIGDEFNKLDDLVHAVFGIRDEAKRGILAKKLFLETVPLINSLQQGIGDLRNDVRGLELQRVRMNKDITLEDEIAAVTISLNQIKNTLDLFFGKKEKIEINIKILLLIVTNQFGGQKVVYLKDDYKTPHIIANPTELNQVFRNLIANALDAVEGQEEGKVVIVPHSESDKTGTYLKVVITDNGPGIPPENITRIFEPYFTTKGDKGTGLGLAIVKRIIKEHGGTITVESELGKGTTFTITLPVATSSPAVADSEAAPSKRSLRLREKDDKFIDSAIFLHEIGVGKDSNIVNVGMRDYFIIGLAAARLGAHYLGFDKEKDSQHGLDHYNVNEFGGNANHILGEFSSNANSNSKDIKDHTQDFVLIMTGALSDPWPVSDAKEVLREALRIIKHQGRIVAGSYKTAWEFLERDKAKRIIEEVLNEPEWKDKVSLRFIKSVNFWVTEGDIYEVLFSNSEKITEPMPVSVTNGDNAASPLTSQERVRILLEENEGLNNVFRGGLFKDRGEEIDRYKEMLRNFLQIPFDQKDKMLARIDAESEIEKIKKARLMWDKGKWGPSTYWGLSLEQGVFLQELPSLPKGQAYDFALHILSSYIHVFAESKAEVKGWLETLGTDEEIVDGWLKAWEITYRYLWAAKILYENKTAPTSSPAAAGSAKPAASPLGMVSQKRSLATLDNDKDFQAAIDLLKKAGIAKNSHVIEVGPSINTHLALAALRLGAHYHSFDAHIENGHSIKEKISRYNINEFGGSFEHTDGYFADPEMRVSQSRGIESRSQDAVVILSVLDQHFRFHNPQENKALIKEALRVIKYRGRLIIGGFDGIKQTEEGLWQAINSLSPAGVELKEVAQFSNRMQWKYSGHIYEVNFSSSPDSAKPGASRPSSSPTEGEGVPRKIEGPLAPQERLVNDLISNLRVLNEDLIGSFNLLKFDFSRDSFGNIDKVIENIKSALHNFRSLSRDPKIEETIAQSIMDALGSPVDALDGLIQLRSEQVMPEIENSVQNYIKEFKNLELIVAAGELDNIKDYHISGHFINIDNLFFKYLNNMIHKYPDGRIKDKDAEELDIDLCSNFTQIAVLWYMYYLTNYIDKEGFEPVEHIGNFKNMYKKNYNRYNKLEEGLKYAESIKKTDKGLFCEALNILLRMEGDNLTFGLMPKGAISSPAAAGSDTAASPMHIGAINFDPRVPMEVRDKALIILQHAGELKELLGVKSLDSIYCRVAQEEVEGGGFTLQFSGETESGIRSFYAKLRDSDEDRVSLVERAELLLGKNRIIVLEEDSDGDWLKYRVRGADGERWVYRRNPTTLEYALTLQAAEEGISPPCRIIEDSLISVGIDSDKGISLKELPGNEEWLRFFLENEVHFIKEIGRTYGILNKKLRIRQVDIRWEHIFITKDKKVYLIDFSTHSTEEGLMSHRMPVGENDYDLFNLTASLEIWLDPYLGLGNTLRQRKLDFRGRLSLYKTWIENGFESVKLSSSGILARDASPQVGLDEIFAKDIELRHVSDGEKPILLKYEGQKRNNSWDYEIYWLGNKVGSVGLFIAPSWHSDKQLLHLQNIRIWPESWQRHGLSASIVDWLYFTAKNNNLDFTITGDDVYLERVLERAKAKYGELDGSGSSPVGGIDMRHLAKNTVIKRDSPVNSLKGQSPPATKASAGRSGTDPKELEEIQRLIQAGIIPATRRLEECRGACSAEALLSCIADILRIEEERVTQTEAGLRNLLASL